MSSIQVRFYVSQENQAKFENIWRQDVTKYESLQHFVKCAFNEKLNREEKREDEAKRLQNHYA